MNELCCRLHDKQIFELIGSFSDTTYQEMSKIKSSSDLSEELSICCFDIVKLKSDLSVPIFLGMELAPYISSGDACERRE